MIDSLSDEKQFSSEELAWATDPRWAPLFERTESFQAGDLGSPCKSTVLRNLEAFGPDLFTMERRAGLGGTAYIWTPTSRARRLAEAVRSTTQAPALPQDRRLGVAFVALIDDQKLAESVMGASGDLYAELRRTLDEKVIASKTFRLTPLKE